MGVWFELVYVGYQSCCILSLWLERNCSCGSLLVSLGWCTCQLPMIFYCNFKALSGELRWKLCFCHATTRKKFLSSDISLITFQKFKAALNPANIIFLNFAKNYVLSCLSNVDNIKNFTLGFLNYKPLWLWLRVFYQVKSNSFMIAWL